MNRSVTTESEHLAGQSQPDESDFERVVLGPNDAEKRGLRSWLLLGLILPLIGMIPLLVLQAQSLFAQPRFMFFPLTIAIGAGLLFGTCRYRIARGLRAKLALGIAILGMAIAVLGSFLFSPWIVQFASVVVVFAWALGAFAGAPWTRVFAICCLFAISVPPPGRIDNVITSSLYSMIGWMCNGFLDAVAVPNIVEGNILQVADLKIRLFEVLGGVDSFSALMAIGMVVAVSRRSTLLVGFALLAFAVPFCYCLSNVIRILAIALGHEYFGSDMTKGSGYIFTAVIIGFGSIISVLLSYVSLKAILETIENARRSNNVTALYRLVASWPNHRQKSSEVLGDTLSSSLPSNNIWGSRIALIAVPCLICLVFGGLAAYVSIVNAKASVAKLRLTEAEVALLPAQAAFPAQYGSMRMVSFVPTLQNDANASSQYSHMWKFDDKGGQVFVTLDFPIQGWRPVWSGYQANGWKILDVKPVDVPSDVPYANLRVEEFEMQNQYGLYGYVWFAFFDDQGVPTVHADDESGGRTNIFTRLRTKANTNSKSYLQVQLFLESGRELTERETQSNRKLFFEIYEQLRMQSEIALKKAK